MAWPQVNFKNRWFYYALVYIYVIGLYASTNHFMVGRAHLLPLTALDKFVPFWPWTSWIYISVYFMPLVAGILARYDEDVRILVTVFTIVGTICTLVFIFYPTIYPRPVMTEQLESWGLLFVHMVDTPANCLPSQHVALGFLSAFFIQRYHRHWGNAAITMAILIAISTLTTKQHYVWDVVTGYFLARFTYLATDTYLVRSRAVR